MTENSSQKLENILDRVVKEANIKNFKNIPNINKDKGDGFSSEIYTGTIINQDNGGTIEVAVKIAPNINSVNVHGFYKNEVNFYSKVFPELNKFQKEHKVKVSFDNIPGYLTGSIEKGKEFVAMENLKIRNYELLDKSKYFDREHLEYIFKTYGKFHALSFAFKQQVPERYENLIKHLELRKFPGFAAFVDEEYKIVLDTFDPIADIDILEKLNKIRNITETISAAINYTGTNKCIIHGDCWSNNMLFKYKV